MKTSHRLLLAAASLVLTIPGHGATQYFSRTDTRNSWNGAFWASSSGGTYNLSWGGYNDAIFEGTGGTVSGGGAVNKWTFNSDGYILTGAFTMGSPSVASFIIGNAGHSATISGNLSYANTANILWKDGAGNLKLSGTNSAYKLYAEQGTLEISGGSTTVANNLYVGRDSFGTATTKLGTMLVSGGTLTINGTDFLMGQTVNGTTKVAQFTQTDGSVTFNGGWMGVANGGGVAQMDLSGGTFTSTTASLSMAIRNNATINISGSAVVNAPLVRIFHSDAVTGSGKTGTINLNGGILVTGSITRGSALSTSIVNFNGGTIKAATNSAGFLDVTSANVLAGGAKIHTNTYDMGISQALLHDSGLGASPDGGLTKDGTGTLTLGGTNTYTGATTLSAGTLLVTGSIDAASAVTAVSGSILGGTGTVAGAINIDGTLAPGTTGTGIFSTGTAVLTGSYACQLDGTTADRWNVTGDLTINGATLAVSEINPANFSYVVIASYTGTLDGMFTLSTPLPAGVTLQHDATNKLIYLARADYATWLDGFTFGESDDTTLTGDPDGDGLSNQHEYAFGLDPTSPVSLQPITVLPNKADGSFTYIRRNPALTGYTYAIWTSENLIDWTEDTTAVQSPTTIGDNESVYVVLSEPAPLSAPSLFIRCAATPPVLP